MRLSRQLSAFECYFSYPKIIILYRFSAVSHSLEPLPSIPFSLPSLGVSLLASARFPPLRCLSEGFYGCWYKKWAMGCSSKKHLSLHHLIILLSENKRPNVCFICHYSLKSDRSSGVLLAPTVTARMNYFTILIYLFSCLINFIVGMKSNKIFIQFASQELGRNIWTLNFCHLNSSTQMSYELLVWNNALQACIIMLPMYNHMYIVFLKQFFIALWNHPT